MRIYVELEKHPMVLHNWVIVVFKLIQVFIIGILGQENFGTTIQLEILFNWVLCTTWKK